MPIISVTNQKGGVGKTTMLASLSRILTDRGYKILCLDLDPQRNLDMMAGKGIPIPLNDTDTPSMLSVLRGECEIEEAIVHTPLGDLARASSLLSGWSGPSIITRKEFEALRGKPSALISVLEERFNREDQEPVYHVLRNKMENISSRYDYVFLDTNPSLMLLTMNALYAADYVLIPVFTDDFSRTAVNELWNTIQNINYYEPWKTLAVAGLVVTKSSKRTFVAQQYYPSFERFAEQIGSVLFETKIRQSVIANEATGAGEPVVDYAGPRAEITKDYNALADEFIARMEYLKKERGV